MDVTEDSALRAYAAMINTYDSSRLEPLLGDDFRYASQWVLHEIESKQEYLDYMLPKFRAFEASGGRIFAEMAWLNERPCVVLAQGEHDHLIGLVLARVEGGVLKRLDFCGVPDPHTARRTGVYPA